MLGLLRESTMFAGPSAPLVDIVRPDAGTSKIAYNMVLARPKAKRFKLLTGISVDVCPETGVTMLATPTIARSVWSQDKMLPPVDAISTVELVQLVAAVLAAIIVIPGRLVFPKKKGEKLPRNRPPVDAICIRFKLNWDQQRFVRLATYRFLYRLIICYRLSPAQKNVITAAFSPFFDLFTGQLFYLGGKAGSGKSKCVKALIEFVERWDALQHLVVCGTSGLAACLLPYGQTRHSANNVGIHWSAVQDPTTEVLQAWQPVFMKVIDECSMMGASEWFEENERCKQLKREFTRPYGGIDCCATGDFSQLEAVQKCSVWVRKQDLKADSADSAAGVDIFMDAMTACILLQTSYRQVDPEWQQDLDALCEGPFTKTNLEHFQDLDITQHPVPLGPETTLICYVNTQRQALTRLSYQLRCRASAAALPATLEERIQGGWRARGALRVDAGMVGKQLVLGHSPGYLPRSFKHFLSRVCDEKHLDNMPGSLGLIIGAKYILTERIDNEMGLARNMWVVLVDICVKDAHVSWDANVLTHKVKASHVQHVIVQVAFKPWKKLFIHPPLGKGLALIIPNRRSLAVQLPSGKKIPLIFTQLPLVPAGVITGHKAEGMGLAECVIFGMSKAPATWFYVAATRTPGRLQTHLAEPPPGNLKRYEQPPALRLFRKKLQLLDNDHRTKWSNATNTRNPMPELNVGKIEREMYDLSSQLELIRLSKWHKHQSQQAAKEKNKDKEEQWPPKPKSKTRKTKVDTQFLLDYRCTLLTFVCLDL